MGKMIPVIERFWSKVEKKKFGYSTECWIWTAYKNKHGYGWFRGENSKKIGGYTGRLAHRWAYEHFKETIKDENELDHLCRNKACVNPDHLRQVTHAENMDSNVDIFRVYICKNGHEYTGDNVLIRTRSDGRRYRVCRTCKREKERLDYWGTPEEMLKGTRKEKYRHIAKDLIIIKDNLIV